MTKSFADIHQFLLDELKERATPEKAKAAARYFPEGFVCLGAKATDITEVVKLFYLTYPAFDAEYILEITEYILQHHQYNEEVLIAFSLLNKQVKKHFTDDLLARFHFWLENYCSNWAHVDDLCLKTIFPFLMARPHLIIETQHWNQSKSPWCRRASNVVWVKFISRKIGKKTYQLDKALVFQNCDTLLLDKDNFVQKSIGWLLKVTLVHHQDDVINYIQHNYQQMPRATIRYALEKLEAEQRKQLLATLN